MFPAEVVYRAKYLEALKDWVIYAKAPFGGPHSVIDYLGRYTHKEQSATTELAVLMMKKER